MRHHITLALLAAGLLVLPGRTIQAATDEIVIKVATQTPRSATAASQEKKINRELSEATGGRVKLRTYFGGSAGDPVTVMRKIRAGQIDAGAMGTQIVSQAVRQCMIFMAPQTFFNYKQVDEVRANLGKEFADEAWKNGFKIMSWYDAGKVRIFSKRPITSFADLRSGRPWLYPESPLLKAFYKMINVTGVPVGLGEVYGALQTDMLDAVWISPVLAMAFRWHTKTSHISRPVGVIIQGAMLVSRKTWEKLSPSDQEAVNRGWQKGLKKAQHDFRLNDEKTYRRLLKRGFKLVELEDAPKWEKAGKDLRDKMIGRIYSKELLARVEKMVAKYGDEPTDVFSRVAKK